MKWILQARLPDGSALSHEPASATCTMGRVAGNDWVIPEGSVSSRHARLVADADGTWTLEDLGSTNGTWMGGETLDAPRALASGDVFKLGDVEVTLRAEKPPAPPKPVKEKKAKAPKPPKAPKAAKSETGTKGRLLSALHRLRPRPPHYGWPVLPGFRGLPRDQWLPNLLECFLLLCAWVHRHAAWYLPRGIGAAVRWQARFRIPTKFSVGYGILAATAAWIGWRALPAYYAANSFSEEHLALLREGGIAALGERVALFGQFTMVFCLGAAAYAWVRNRRAVLAMRVALVAYLLLWFYLHRFHTELPVFLNDADYKSFSNAMRNEYWLKGWVPWFFALPVPALVLLGLVLRVVQGHYRGVLPAEDLAGDRVVENLRTGGRDPHMRSSTYWATFLVFAYIVAPFLVSQCGWERPYGLIKGSGEPVVEMVKVKKKKKKPQKKMIVNNWSPYIFERMKIDDIKILDEIEEETLDTYEIQQEKTGKLGKGGGKTGGWPEGMEGATVRFIRLEYAGGDWDQDMGKGSDYNLLLRFNKITGFPIARETESKDPARLRMFPKGKKPPFVYMTGKRGVNFSSTDIKTLRWYTLEEGGMLFIDNGGGSFDRAVRGVLGQVFPGQRLIDIPNDDPIYQAPFVFPGGAPPLWQHSGTRAMGIRHEGRWVVFYHQGDMGDAWKDGHSGTAPEVAEQAYRLGVNIMYYAFNMYYARHYEK
jgi:hypothetical protein